MLPSYKTEDNVIIEKPVRKEIKKCSICENEKNPDNYIKNKTICRACHREYEKPT